MAGLTFIGFADPQERTRVKVPKGFKTKDEFLEEMRERYDNGKSFNQHNQDAGQQDASFVVGDQWEDFIEERRRKQRKPTLVFNRLVAFMAQIVGNRLMNETEIRVWPDKSGTKPIAELRESIIRSIYKNSQSDFARDEALKYQVIGGQGAFCLSMEWADDDVFAQNIKIKPISDPYAATFDPLSIEPSGEDAEWATVEDDLTKPDFEKRWPWAADVSFASSSWDRNGYWVKQDTIRVVSYWRMVTEGTKTLALYLDGTVHDVTDMEEFEYINDVDTRSDGSPYTRDVPNRFARMYICSGTEILEGPFDYPISSIPVYRVPGWEITDGKKLHRFGLVRFLKDPQRLDNYWASMVAEQLVSAPRNKWLTTPEAIKGHEQRWRRSPMSDDPFLFFNDGEMAPVAVPPPGIDAALMAERQKMSQDMKDISNIHEASLGMPSNEVSGKALQNRQQISDVGTFIYHDRLKIADERCAKNINELIPYIYDTHRMIAIIGRDNESVMAVINDPTQPDSDVTVGEYGVTVTTGPSSVTKRALAAEQMMAFVNAIPGVAASVMHLVAEAQDWPQSDEFARIFRLMAPPGTIPLDQMTPEEQQMQAQNQQMQQLQQQLQLAQAHAEISDKSSKANLQIAQAGQARANAYKALLDAHSRASDVAGKNADRTHGAVMDVLDQHNDMVADDHDFVLDLAKHRHDRQVAHVDLALQATQQAHNQQIATQNQRFQEKQAEQNTTSPTGE